MLFYRTKYFLYSVNDYGHWILFRKNIYLLLSLSVIVYYLFLQFTKVNNPTGHVRVYYTVITMRIC